MTRSPPHTMDARWIADQMTTRYSCRSCGRCVEDGPEGLRVLVRGDVSAVHRGGVLTVQAEVDADGGDAVPAPAPVLH